MILKRESGVYVDGVFAVEFLLSGDGRGKNKTKRRGIKRQKISQLIKYADHERHLEKPR